MSLLLDYPSELKSFSRDAAVAVELAHGLGWRIAWQNTRRRVVQMFAPGGEVTINVPTTNVNAKRSNAFVRQVIRHSDPGKIADYADKITDHVTKKALEAQALAREMGVESPGMKKTALGMTKTDRLTHEVKQRAEEMKTIARKAPRIVSETPWLARKGGIEDGPGRMYESEFVVRQVYSDGTETFACKQCGWSNDNPRSVTMHASRSKDHVSTRTAPEVVTTTSYEGSGITRSASPSRRLVADLTAALDSIKDWQSMDTVALAEAVASTMAENAPERTPAEPLTDAQVLSRIATLVDRGRLAEADRQVSSLADELRVAKAALDAERDAREAAEDRAVRARDNIHALREMLGEVEVL